MEKTGSDLDGVMAYNDLNVADYRPFRKNVYYRQCKPTKYVKMRIDVVINGENYPMFKVNPLDDNYTDGCDYYYTTYLQPGSYNYYFECEDYKFTYSTSTYSGPMVSENPNANSPTLTIGQVLPDNGLCNQTSFIYTIIDARAGDA